MWLNIEKLERLLAKVDLTLVLWKFFLGPYAWVEYVPGEPILPNQPNEGSVKRRNEKKQIKQHLAFILVCAFLVFSFTYCFFFFPENCFIFYS